MPIDASVLIAVAIVANLLVIGAILALPGRRTSSAPSSGQASPRAVPRTAAPGNAADAAPSPMEMAATGAPSYDHVLRIVWWVTIAAVLVGVGLSGAYVENQPYIYGVGGAAVMSVVILHELLPTAWRSSARFWIEALVAIGLLTGLLALTGFADSPFFFGYIVVAVAVALTRGGRATFLFAALSSIAYLAIVALDPQRGAFAGADLLRYGLNVASVWLLAYLAGVFASRERRVRSTFLELSVTDSLTGLFNRSQIFSTLDHEIRRTRRSERGFCLLMVDLDGLKAVNDTLGHHRGDDVLRRLGAVIKRSIRVVDTAYRYGGDEFVVLLPETDFVGAFVVAEKIRAGAEEVGATLGRDGLDTSVSIGLVSHPEDGATVDELMIAADAAMYQAKSLGKNQISGYPRPRRTPPALPAAAEPSPTPPAPDELVARIEPDRTLERRAGERTVERRAGERTPPIGLRPLEVHAPGGNGVGEQDDEPDPTEVRRQIAAAARSFDPDHQIRRAMDAFLSPSRPGEDPDR